MTFDGAMRVRLADMRKKLTRLAALDAGRAVFGSKPGYGHDYREQPAMSPAQIAALEVVQGFTFPDELCAFLECVHGGGPGPGYWFAADTMPGPRAARPFPYGRAEHADLLARRASDRYASLDIVEDGDDSFWPPGDGFLPIAEHGCGVTDVIVVTGELRGQIWCCDMAWRPYSCGFLDWYESWLDANLSRWNRSAVLSMTA